MKITNTIPELQQILADVRAQGKSIAFVPTMGNLHNGHMSLIDTAVRAADYVVCSIFVNPTQFGENEDLDSYPRTLEADCDLLTKHGCNLVFTPSVEQMYPSQPQISLKVGEISSLLCGANRPGHFDGVATIVSKLFNIVQPDTAVFGQKDYQQLAIIRELNDELYFGINIIGVPTVRNEQGLALSSRNGYLSSEQLIQALNISQAIKTTGTALEAGETDIKYLQKQAIDSLTTNGFEVDYFEIKQTNLQNVTAESTEFVILCAAKLGSTRLIDNMTFSCNKL